MTTLINDNTPVTVIQSKLGVSKPSFDDTCVITWTPTQEALDECELEDKLYCVMLRTKMTPDEFCETFNMKPSPYCLMFFASPEATKEQAEQGVRELMDRADEFVLEPEAGTDRGFLDF